jgi:hypothetical protein
MALNANIVINKVEKVEPKEALPFQSIRESAVSKSLRFESAVSKSLRQDMKEQNQINTIKTSKYLEDLTNKGD